MPQCRLLRLMICVAAIILAITSRGDTFDFMDVTVKGRDKVIERGLSEDLTVTFDRDSIYISDAVTTRSAHIDSLLNWSHRTSPAALLLPEGFPLTFGNEPPTPGIDLPIDTKNDTTIIIPSKQLARSALGNARAAASTAASRWLHIFHRDGRRTLVSTHALEDYDRIVYTRDADGSRVMRVTPGLIAESDTVKIENISSIEVGVNVPTIFIDTDLHTPVTSKTSYVDATLSVKGYGLMPDTEATRMRVRGRGNTTWYMPKKPYRLNFPDGKISLCGMTKAKNYVLIANYLDGTMMHNAIAFKIANILDMPYTNRSVPVNLVFNGEYAGAYMLSEKIGINKASVNINEDTGALLELDSYYDEDYKFRSPSYDLPVMVKDPDLGEGSTAANQPTGASESPSALGPLLADACMPAIPLDASTRPVLRQGDLTLYRWADDFNRMERAVYDGVDDLSPYLDITSVANYLIVCCLCGNHELNTPKSVYIYKAGPDDVYHIGPVWDFDIAFNVCDGSSVTYPLLNHDDQGSRFFKTLAGRPDVIHAINERWEKLYSRSDELLEYFEDYAETIRPQAAQNGIVWPSDPTESISFMLSTDRFTETVNGLRSWLTRRLSWMHRHPKHGIIP